MTIDKENFIVPNYYSDNTTNQFVIGKNVSGIDLSQMSKNMNYLLGNGMYQIPNTVLGISPTAGNNQSFRVRPKLWSNVHDRYWNFKFSSNTYNIGIGALTVSSSQNGLSFPNFGLNEGENYFSFKENCQYTGEVWTHDDCDIIFYNFSAVSQNATLDEVSIFNAPTRYLNPTTQLNEVAVDNKSNESYDKIYSTAYKENSSIAGIAKGIDYFKNNYVKGIVSFIDNYASNGVVTYITNLSTNGPTSTFSPAIQYNGFATANHITQSSKLVYWEAYVATEGGVAEPGRLEISTSYGTVGTNFTNTSPAWISGTIQIQTETPQNFNGILANSVNGISGNITLRIGKTIDLGANRAALYTLHLFETLLDAQ